MEADHFHHNLDRVQSDKKIKTLTDTAELIEDAVHSATVIIIIIIIIVIIIIIMTTHPFLMITISQVEQSSEMLNSILKWSHNNKIRKLNTKSKVIIIIIITSFSNFTPSLFHTMQWCECLCICLHSYHHDSFGILWSNFTFHFFNLQNSWLTSTFIVQAFIQQINNTALDTTFIFKCMQYLLFYHANTLFILAVKGKVPKKKLKKKN